MEAQLICLVKYNVMTDLVLEFREQRTILLFVFIK